MVKVFVNLQIVEINSLNNYTVWKKKKKKKTFFKVSAECHSELCAQTGNKLKGFYMSFKFKENKTVKGVLHPWAVFLKILCIFSKNKATSDKVSYGSGQKCSKELENYSFTSVEIIVVKLQWKMCENQYFPCFEP